MNAYSQELSGKSENILPSFTSGLWYTWSPYLKAEPAFIEARSNHQPVLGINGNTTSGSYGKWISPDCGVKPGTSYLFTIEYLAENISCELAGISVVLTWHDAKGLLLARDYADKTEQGVEGWKIVFRRLEAPPAACSVKVELSANWIANGRVLFHM